MKRRPFTPILAFSLSLLVCPSFLHAQTITFEILATLAYPGALTTIAHGINDEGDVVGEILLPFHGFPNGFVRTNDTFSLPIIFPGSEVSATIATAINNEGTVAGWYSDTQGISHGFFLADGVYTSYDHPSAVFSTKITGINDAGDFVGTYSATEGIFIAFASVGGKLRQITLPRVNSTEPADISNSGDIVGTGRTISMTAGFRREKRGRLQFPLQRERGNGTYFFGTNEAKETVGQENGALGLYFDGGTAYATYAKPGLINNAFTGINSQGVICGYGFDSIQRILYSYLVQRVITGTQESP